MLIEGGIATTINDKNVKGDTGEISWERAATDGALGALGGAFGAGGAAAAGKEALKTGLKEGLKEGAKIAAKETVKQIPRTKTIYSHF